MTTAGPARPVPRRRAWLLLLAVLVLGAVAVSVLGSRYRVRQEREEGLRASRLGHLQEAEPLLQRALERDPDDCDALQGLVSCLLDRGALVDAEASLSHWCSLRPEATEPFKLRMDLRHRRARTAPAAADGQRLLEQALADGRHVLELDPEDEPVAHEVVWLMLRVGRFEEAEPLCRRCLRHQPGDPWLTYLLARIRHSQGAAAEARALLDPLLERHPRFTQGLFLRAVLYNEAGEPERAIPLLRQVVALGAAAPPEARYELTLALARAGQTPEAERLLAELGKANLDMLRASTGKPNTAYERPGQPERAAAHRRRADP